MNSKKKTKDQDKDLHRRFWEKVKISTKLPDPVNHAGVLQTFSLPCLLWQGATDQDNYGIFRAPPGTLGTPSGLVRAHRLSKFWETKFPINCEVDHLCRNKRCVRTSHLKVLGPKTHGRISRKDQEKC